MDELLADIHHRAVFAFVIAAFAKAQPVLIAPQGVHLAVLLVGLRRKAHEGGGTDPCVFAGERGLVLQVLQGVDAVHPRLQRRGAELFQGHRVHVGAVVVPDELGRGAFLGLLLVHQRVDDALHLHLQVLLGEDAERAPAGFGRGHGIVVLPRTVGEAVEIIARGGGAVHTGHIEGGHRGGGGFGHLGFGGAGRKADEREEEEIAECSGSTCGHGECVDQRGQMYYPGKGPPIRCDERRGRRMKEHVPVFIAGTY